MKNGLEPLEITKEVVAKKIVIVGMGKIEKTDNKDCKHELVVREYIGQPYGTCVECGKTIFGDG